MNDLLQKELQEIKDLLLSRKKVLTLDEVTKYTGYKKSYIYQLTSKNKVPYSRPSGGAIFFDREDIDTWLLQNKQWTQSSTIL
ncbi:helix-turn-helix domain-containing protein [Flavobacteriaceae bacterium]|nr:helix-turn-helix domain-containing protein [Flavobacteriaceae bacterium]